MPDTPRAKQRPGLGSVKPHGDATKETVTLASDDLIMGRVLQITRPLF